MHARVEVKAGESLKVQPELGKVIHISQVGVFSSTSIKPLIYFLLHFYYEILNVDLF